MIAPRAIDARRRVTIMDKTTLPNKGIHTLDPNKFMWI